MDSQHRSETIGHFGNLVVVAEKISEAGEVFLKKP